MPSLSDAALGLARLVVGFFSVCLSLLMLLPGATRVRAAIVHFMTEYRGWFVIVFVLPFSLLFDVFFVSVRRPGG